MSKLLLVPLDDIVVFPQHERDAYRRGGRRGARAARAEARRRVRDASARSREVTDRVRLPGGATRSRSRGSTAVSPARPRPTRRAASSSRSRSADEAARRRALRELETEYRAVVEEILELRGDDGRIQAFVRSIAEPGALADTSGYSPDLTLRAEGCSCSRPSTCRASRARAGVPARAAVADAAPPADPRGRQRRASRSSSASSSCASRSTRSARSSATTRRPSSRSTARRSRRRGCRRRCASRPTRSSAASSGWARARPSRR